MTFKKNNPHNKYPTLSNSNEMEHIQIQTNSKYE